MQRFGQVIGIHPEHVQDYEQLHAQIWPEVREQLHAYHIRNYTIFRHGTLLFAYYEYVGTDYAADMARMAAVPLMHAWWALTEPLQQPLPERGVGAWWRTLPEVFHHE